MTPNPDRANDTHRPRTWGFLGLLVLGLAFAGSALADHSPTETSRTDTATQDQPAAALNHDHTDPDFGSAHTPRFEGKAALARDGLLRAIDQSDVVLLVDPPTAGWTFERTQPRATLRADLYAAWGCGTPTGRQLEVRVPWNAEMGRLDRQDRPLLVVGRATARGVAAHTVLPWNGETVTIPFPRLEVPMAAADLDLYCQGETKVTR